MNSNEIIFRYQVNIHHLGKHFRDNGKTPKYYDYESKDFYGAVIRTKKPLPILDRMDVVVLVRNRFSNGSFRGVKLDFIALDDERINAYNISANKLPEVKINIFENPGNIVINKSPSLCSLFFHDGEERKTHIINFIPHE